MKDEDPRTLASRVARVFGVLERHADAACPDCRVTVCGHLVVFGIAAGHEDAPLCLTCLAARLERDAQIVRDELAAFVASKDCLDQGWRMASVREGLPVGTAPSCLWSGAEVTPAKAVPDDAAPADGATHVVAETWDAGDMGCGELVLKLRKRVEALDAGAVLRLLATDPGAPEDIPAWCRLTGHGLVNENHPEYLIRRKE